MIPTYLDAAVILGNRKTKKLANHTYLRKEGDDYVIRLHETDIVTLKPAECTEYVLNTGGWYTSTTKARINDYSPARIFTKGGVWYVTDTTGKTYLYEDGMIINGCGVVLSSLKTEEEAKPHLKHLNKKVKAYVDEFVSREIVAPSSGDCWYCLFGLQHPKMATGDLGHVLSHLFEGYYVPSLYALAVMLKRRMPDLSAYYSRPWFREKTEVRRTLLWFFNRYRVGLLRVIMDMTPEQLAEAEALGQEVEDCS
jgi:hypothetical protein